MTLSTYQAAVLADGPVVYLPLYDTSGNLLDESGNGNHATPIGTLLHASRPSPLDGDTRTYLELAGAGRAKINGNDPPFAAAQQGYIEVWVQPDLDFDPVDANTLHVLSVHGATSNTTEHRFTLGTNRGDIASLVASSSELINPQTSVDLLVPGEWHMIGLNVAQDDSTGLYIDGELYGGGSETQGYWWGDIAISGVEFMLGAARYAGSYVQWFDGGLAHLSLYDHPLSEHRIRRRYCLARPSECTSFLVGAVGIG